MLKNHLNLALLLSSLLMSQVPALADTAAPLTEPLPQPSQQHSPSSYVIVDPKMRAQDYKEAFEVLRKEKTTGKVFFQLNNGSTIANIIDMTLMANSTLILFRFNSTQGIRFQVVKVEEIALVSYT